LAFVPAANPSAPTSAQIASRRVGLVALSLFALIVGLTTAIGAAALRALMALIHNAFFLGKLSFYYDANVFDPPNPWGPLIILAPVIGGLGVIWLVRNFAPEARGHGVPEVMDAIYYRAGRIRMIVIFVKSLASALSIGSGASVGREGPIIQIGSGIGSTIGLLFRMPAWQTITLVAAGAGAGIAATFNTPLGGVMFAIELMLPEVSTRTFLPVVISTGAATYLGWLFFGFEPAFLVPVTGLPDVSFNNSVEFLPVYVILGLLCGVASAAFVRLLHWMEDGFEAIPGNDYTRNIIGMLCVGVLIYGLEATLGHYYVAGVGYSTIQAVLRGEIVTGSLLAALFAAKLLATTLSLGSGASGGIFSPSLFMGATIGGSLGALLSGFWPELGVNSPTLAIIGMAAVVGSGTGAAMTAILMIYEMTRDYAAVVPAIIAVAVALGVRRTLTFENIYTMKLARRGHHIPKERHSHMFLIRHARDVMLPVLGRTTREDLAATLREGKYEQPGFVIVTDGRRIAGLAPVGGAAATEAQLERGFIIVRGDDFLRNVMHRMSRPRRDLAIVVEDVRGVPRADAVIGVLTRRRIADRIIDDFAE
jgi:chloride channel protein, CIC family